MSSSYTAAFRAEAVKLVLEQHLNVPQAAKQLAMPKQTLDRWVKLAQQGQLARLDQHRVQPVDELNAEIARLKRELAESKMECTFLKKCRSVLCKGIHAKYAFMSQQRKQYSIVQMAHWLGLSRSGFYAWQQAQSAPKQVHRQRLEVQVRAAHAHGRMTYGPRRLQKELAADGVQIGLNQLRYLRRRLGLRCIQARKFKATTHSNHSLPVQEN